MACNEINEFKMLMSKPQKALLLLAAAGLGLLSLWFGLTLALHRPLGHDENLYVSAGVLLLNHGLLPYADYHYAHTPLLIPVYAGLFALSDHLLLAARSFNVVCGSATVLLVFAMCFAGLHSFGFGIRLLMALALALFFNLNTQYVYTSGLAWNHDLSTLAMLASFWLLVAGLRKKSPPLLIACGVLLGVAVGVRLSFAVAAAPFVGLILWHSRRELPAMWRRLGWVCLGGVVGSLPLLAMLAAWPAETWFGNVTSIGLNDDYRAFRVAQGLERPWDWFSKLRFMLKDILFWPGHHMLMNHFLTWSGRIFIMPFAQNLLLALALAAVVIPLRLRRAFRHGPNELELRGCLWLLPFLLLAAWAPALPVYQYFYALVPWSLLALAYSLGDWWEVSCKGGRRAQWWTRLLTASAGGLAVLALLVMLHFSVVNWARPYAWGPMGVHRVGQELAGLVGPGPVLTLAPIYAQEGGLPIYPELARGPYSFREAPHLDPELRQRYKLAGPQELSALLAQRPPAAILTQVERERRLEKPLEDWARQHAYQPHALKNGGLLWLPAQ